MSRNTDRQCAQMPRASLYEEITVRIIADLERGTVPWAQPWGVGQQEASLGLPRNAATGKTYSGINILILWGQLFENGYTSQNWLTFRQAKTLGGSVRKGEQADFRLAVDRERALGQLDDIVAHYEAFLRHEGPAGPGATRLRREFARVQNELGDLPGRIMDRKRLRTMLVHLGRTLHVGFLNDCLFEAATALCLTEAPHSKRMAPALSRCSPDRCPNACLTARHREPWQASIAEGEALLADRHLSRLQRAAITRDNERKRRLIAPLTDGDA